MLKLSSAAARGERGRVGAAVRAIVDAASERGEDRFADRLCELARITGTASNNSNDRGAKHVITTQGSHRLDDLWLDAHVRRTAAQLVAEQKAANTLDEAGLSPRLKLLLTGPPGNGKTALAGAIAHELERPLHHLSYETLIGSLLGQSGSNLRHVFEFAHTEPCVLFLDEVEAIAKERDMREELGEMKRVVAGLLLQLDATPPRTGGAATNHPDMLDRATWRRFDARLAITAPPQDRLVRFIESCCSRHVATLGMDAGRIAEALTFRSYGEAEDLCLELQRTRMLSPERDPGTVLDEAIEARRREPRRRSDEAEKSAGTENRD